MTFGDLFDDAPVSPPQSESANAMAGHSPALCTLFFALMPKPTRAQEMAHAAAQWDREAGVHGKPRPPELLHLSLHAVGSYRALPATELAFALRVGSSVSKPAFNVMFDSAMTFGGRDHPRVLCVNDGAGQVYGLWQALGIAIANAGRSVKARKFTPHMTVSYGGRAQGVQPIASMYMEADEFVLINSLYGQGIYEVLGRWPLLR